MKAIKIPARNLSDNEIKTLLKDKEEFIDEFPSDFRESINKTADKIKSGEIILGGVQEIESEFNQ